MPFWPYGQWFAVAFILFTFGTMVWMEEFHTALIVGVAFLILMTILYFVTGRPQAIAEDEVEYEAK